MAHETRDLTAEKYLPPRPRHRKLSEKKIQTALITHVPEYKPYWNQNACLLFVYDCCLLSLSWLTRMAS